MLEECKKGRREISDKEYFEALNEAVCFFKSHREIKSKALGIVHLNADGLRHLIYKDAVKRNRNVQCTRFRLLQYLPEILEGMKFYQEYFEKTELIKVKELEEKTVHAIEKGTTLKRRKKRGVFLVYKLVKYWGFVAVIHDQIRVKIILKKIGERNTIFYSIMPAWEMDGYKKILHKGDIEND